MIRVMNDFYEKVDLNKLDEQQKTELLEFYRDGVRSIAHTLGNEESDLFKLFEIGRHTRKIYTDVLCSFEQKEGQQLPCKE